MHPFLVLSVVFFNCPARQVHEYFDKSSIRNVISEISEARTPKLRLQGCIYGVF